MVRHDSSSDEDAEKKKRKREEKKARKKEKKRRKQEAEVETTRVDDKPKDRASFFAALIAAEAAKPPVGTFHATGKRDASVAEKEPGDWECQKCGYKNFKESLTCAKCRALRRFEGRNQPPGYCQ